MAGVLFRLMCLLLFAAWVGEWPLANDAVLYNGMWRSSFVALGPLFVPVPGLRLFPWQILVMLLLPASLLSPGAFRRRASALDGALLVALGAVAITFLWGVLRGGGPYEAYYQLWRFLNGLLVAAIVHSLLRSPRDLKALGFTIVAAATIRAALTIYFFFTYIKDKIDPPPEYVINHDDAVLCVVALLVLLAWAFVNGKAWRWLVAVPLALHIFYAVVLNDRRIAWVQLALGLVAIYFLMGPGRLRRRVNRIGLVTAPVLLLYVAAGWGREGGIFAPVAALSSVGSDADPSSLARQEEIRNLLYTLSIAGNPVLGTGWGVPYQRATSAYANYAAEWALALYTPHNSVMGVAVFGGFVGIFGMWLVVPVGAYFAAKGYRAAADPTVRVAGMVAIGILPVYGVHCYGDIGIQSFVANIFLGIALGVAGKMGAGGFEPRAPRERT